ncbi:tumor necrosis factor receptor superfamily member 11B-like isoform X2 [Argopecten irradians]|uniref:tumor necrosis factor receptor superfamily member 11B-like isoform X2 n=1 Tax=Argopecten irradians TaxID=31199 RepID=UPI003716B939
MNIELAVVLVTTYKCLSAFVMMETTHTYTTDSGRTCIMCPPGYFFHSDCNVTNTIAVCEPCPTGTFSILYSKAKSCEDCLNHCESEVLVIVKNCTATTNMVCDCPNGTILENEDKKHAKCNRGPMVPQQGNVRDANLYGTWRAVCIAITTVLAVFVIATIFTVVLLKKRGWIQRPGGQTDRQPGVQPDRQSSF